MAVVIGNIIKVDGVTVGTLDESKYEVPAVFSVEYRKNNVVYVIS